MKTNKMTKSIREMKMNEEKKKKAESLYAIESH